MLGLIVTLVKGAMTVAPAIEAVANARTHRKETEHVEKAWATQAERDAMLHAWEWMQFHVRQRLMTAGLFAIAIAILLAAYTLALVQGFPSLGAAIAVAGLFMAFFVNRIDAQLQASIRPAITALDGFQARLAESTRLPQMMLIDAATSRSAHQAMIVGLQALALLGFVAALAYALGRAL